MEGAPSTPGCRASLLRSVASFLYLPRSRPQGRRKRCPEPPFSSGKAAWAPYPRKPLGREANRGFALLEEDERLQRGPGPQGPRVGCVGGAQLGARGRSPRHPQVALLVCPLRGRVLSRATLAPPRCVCGGREPTHPLGRQAHRHAEATPRRLEFRGDPGFQITESQAIGVTSGSPVVSADPLGGQDSVTPRR